MLAALDDAYQQGALEEAEYWARRGELVDRALGSSPSEQE